MLRLLIHTIFPLMAVLAIVFGFLQWQFPGLSRRVATWFGGRFWVSLSVTVLVVYTAALGCSLYLPMVIDFIEASVASLSFIALHGRPVYTQLQDVHRTSLLYGPLCYLPYSAALAIFGPGIASLKGAVLFFNLALFAVLWFAFRRVAGRTETLVALAFIAGAQMMLQMTPFLIRGDAALALAVACGFLAAGSRRTALAVGLFALSCAYAIDIKFTAVFYFLLPFYLLWRNRGSRPALITATLVPGLVLLPFALPSISLINYLAWLHEAAHHPLSLKMFAMNVVAASIMLGAPLLVFARYYSTDREAAMADARQHILPAALFLLSIAGSLLTGSKLGAGRPHLNPTFIVAAYVAAVLWKKCNAPPPNKEILTFAAVTYTLLLVIPAAAQLRDMWDICVLRRGFAQSASADIDGILRSHPGQRIEMGYDQAQDGTPVDGLTSLSPQLVFAGEPETINVGAMFDMGLSGLPIPPSTVKYIQTCQTQVWLIPRGNAPFTTLNLYAQEAPRRFADPHLFSPEFRNAFYATYRKTASSRYYDLWTCPSHG